MSFTVNYRDIPDVGGNVWRLGIDSNGSLITTNLGSGVASPFYVDSGTSTWKVTADLDGALLTEEEVGSPESLVFWVDNRYVWIGIDTEGVLFTASFVQPFFSMDDKRSIFSVPQYTRMRHRYRGSRESEKINLEIDQFTYSVFRLFESQQTFRQTFSDDVDRLFLGGESDVNDETNEPIDLLGIETLVTRIEQAQKRISALELRGN